MIEMWIQNIRISIFEIVWYGLEFKQHLKMDSTGTNMCKAVEIEGVAVKATFESRVCVGGKMIILM